MNTSMNMLVHAANAPETSLPHPEPLTLTRNFGLVVAICLAALVIAPLLIAWTASVLLS